VEQFATQMVRQKGCQNQQVKTLRDHNTLCCNSKAQSCVQVELYVVMTTIDIVKGGDNFLLEYDASIALKSFKSQCFE